MLSRNITNFIGCDSKYEDSQFVLFGAPFDGTTSYRPGARFAPAKIRQESYGIETYSPYLNKDLCNINVFDGGDLEIPFGNTKKVIEQIYNCSTKFFKDCKIPLLLGGEHLVSLGSIKAAVEHFKDLCVVHFDAHTDLREHYLSESLSHATVMRRIYDLLGDNRIFQFCIRSGEREEFEFADKHTILNKFNFSNLDKAMQMIGDRPVYLSIDLDCLDPSEFPATGTPEAGGVKFSELIEAIAEVGCGNVIAADLVELSPPYDFSGISTALTCKTLRELILSINKR